MIDVFWLWANIERCFSKTWINLFFIMMKNIKHDENIKNINLFVIMMNLFASNSMRPCQTLLLVQKLFQQSELLENIHTHTEKFFWILLNQSKIRLYLPFSDWFGSKRNSVWIQFNRKMVNAIWFPVDFTKLKKYSHVCTNQNVSNIVKKC